MGTEVDIIAYKEQEIIPVMQLASQTLLGRNGGDSTHLESVLKNGFVQIGGYGMDLVNFIQQFIQQYKNWKQGSTHVDFWLYQCYDSVNHAGMVQVKEMEHSIDEFDSGYKATGRFKCVEHYQGSVDGRRFESIQEFNDWIVELENMRY